MKYLKTYESINSNLKHELENLGLKKYIILKSLNVDNSIKFLIVEILKIGTSDYSNNITANIEKLFYYDNSGLKKPSELKNFNIRLKNIVKKSIYNSNDLQDCLKMVSTLFDSEKYNL